MLIPGRPGSLAYRMDSLRHLAWRRRHRAEAERLFQRAIATLAPQPPNVQANPPSEAPTAPPR